MELHDAHIELKLTGADEQGVISGVANVMELTDLGGDVIRAGAFTKTLHDNGGKFPLEIDHGAGLKAEIGVGFFSVVGNELRLDRGEINLDAVDIRDEIYPRLKFRQQKGLPAGLSINYRIPKGKYKFLPDGRREITEIALRKVGVIDEPMNQQSYIDAVKSLDGGEDGEFSKAMRIVSPDWSPTDFTSAMNGMSRSMMEDRRRYGMWAMDEAMSNLLSLVNESNKSDIQNAMTQVCNDHRDYMVGWSKEAVKQRTGGKAQDDDPEAKAGRRLSAKNAEIIRQMMETMQSMLDDNEGDLPMTPDKQLSLRMAMKALSALEPDSSTPDGGKPPEVDPKPSEEIKSYLEHFESRKRDFLAAISR